MSGVITDFNMSIKVQSQMHFIPNYTCLNFDGCNVMAAKIFMVDSKPLSSITSGKIWLAWVQWPLCGKSSNDGKC